ncbi:hypothetical protein GW17_00040152 [Ensete ventricosum]|nr:hypothetical protein GW17_00040152 [Ensete ventricosum]
MGVICRRYDRDFGPHHMERFDVCDGKPIACRGRSVGKYGAWIQEGLLCYETVFLLLQGDILFLQMNKDPIRAGEIVVFNVDVSTIVNGREIPIVHRVIKVHERHDTGEIQVLTKGDNNFDDDRLLYAHGQLWLEQHHIMGRAVGFLPYLGWVTIIMTEKPIVKFLLMGALGLLIITAKE